MVVVGEMFDWVVLTPRLKPGACAQRVSHDWFASSASATCDLQALKTSLASGRGNLRVIAVQRLFKAPALPRDRQLQRTLGQRRIIAVSPVWTAGFDHVAGALIFWHTRLMPDRWIEAWLGAARFKRYLDECAGDRSRALALYEWNVELGQALMHDIAHFEVALRNAYDTTISASWPHRTHWLLHPESPAVMPIWRTKSVKGVKRGSDVNFLTRRNVDEAIKKCGYGNANPGKVIAELTFGFWRQFTTASMEKSVWVPYLHRAFPRGTSRSTVDAQISAVNTLRNRIAHHEPLFAQTLDPNAVHDDMMECLLLLSPDVHTHVLRTSSVLPLLAAKP